MVFVQVCTKTPSLYNAKDNYIRVHYIASLNSNLNIQKTATKFNYNIQKTSTENPIVAEILLHFSIFTLLIDY